MVRVIARKPRDQFNEYVVIKRDGLVHPYVSATANEISLAGGEWFWGYYFQTMQEALDHFNARGRS